MTAKHATGLHFRYKFLILFTSCFTIKKFSLFLIKSHIYSKIAAVNYEYIKKGCVNGHNIVTYRDSSIDECKEECNKRRDCLAFEYGVNYGGPGSYYASDCVLNSGRTNANCGGYHNLDLFIKLSKSYTFSFCISGFKT